jgi:hypothetical protein
MNNLFEEIGVKKEEEKSKGSVDEVNKSINRELEVNILLGGRKLHAL